MNIAIIGYGKMGHIIERVAKQRRHRIVCIIDVNNQQDFESENFRSAEVAIEFSTPQTAVDNIRHAWKSGIPVVSGTTGWNDMLPTLRQEAENTGKGLFWTSNYSIGVNAVREINRRLAEIMRNHSEYRISITETHHIHKKDAPSGTAIMLAQDIVNQVEHIKEWRTKPQTDDPCTQLEITSIRQGEEPGTHIVTYDGPADTITITHKAKSREGFAFGAVIAAEFMKGKTGFHDMSEIL